VDDVALLVDTPDLLVLLLGEGEDELGGVVLVGFSSSLGQTPPVRSRSISPSEAIASRASPIGSMPVADWKALRPLSPSITSTIPFSTCSA